MSEEDWKVPKELRTNASSIIPTSSDYVVKEKKSAEQHYEEETRKRAGIKNTLRDRGVDTQSPEWQAAKRAMDALDAKRKSVHAARKHRPKDLLLEEDS